MSHMEKSDPFNQVLNINSYLFVLLSHNMQLEYSNNMGPLLRCVPVMHTSVFQTLLQ